MGPDRLQHWGWGLGKVKASGILPGMPGDGSHLQGSLGPPSYSLETQQRQCYSAFQKPFVGVACSTPIPAAQAAVDTQTDT